MQELLNSDEGLKKFLTETVEAAKTCGITKEELIDLYEALIELEMNDFAKLVLEMRTAQKEYFRTRDRGATLQKCKALEKLVDEHLKQMDTPKLF